MDNSPFFAGLGVNQPGTGFDLQISFLGIQEIDGRRQAETCTGPFLTLIKNVGHTTVIDFRQQLNKGGFVHAVPDIRRILPDIEDTFFSGSYLQFHRFNKKFYAIKDLGQFSF